MARSSSSTPICLWRDVWHRATPLDLLTDRISVVALVGVQDVAVRKPFEQRLSSGAVCYLSASEHEGKRATLSVCQRVDFRRAAAANGRWTDFSPPFSACCGAMRLNGGTVDQNLGRRPTSLSQCAKQTDPHAFGGPAHVSIIECLPRAIFRGRIDPTGT